MPACRPDSSVRPIYVLAGKDRPLVGLYYQELIDSLLDRRCYPTCLVRYEGPGLSLSDVLDELCTTPMFGPRKVVVVEDADAFASANSEGLQDYLNRPCPTGVLVLVVSRWDGRTGLAKQVAAMGGLISATGPRPYLMAEELTRMAAKKYRKRLLPDAAGLLVELVGQDWARLCAELEKLAIYVGDQGRIGVEDVESLAGHTRQFSGFSVIDRATMGQIGQAVCRLRKVFEQDRSASYTVIGAFAYHVRRLLQAKTLLAGGASWDYVAKELRLFQRDKDTFVSLAGRLTPDCILQLLEALAEADYRIKTGQARADVALEIFVLALARGNARWS